MGIGRLLLLSSNGGQVPSTVNKFFDNGIVGANATIDWRKGDLQAVTLSVNCSFTYIGAVPGQACVLDVYAQTNGLSVTNWPAPLVWFGGVTPSLTGLASRFDRITSPYDGTTYGASIQPNCKPYNPNFVPTDISDCVFFLDPTDPTKVTVSGGLVSQIVDKSDNAFLATASGTNRPTQAVAALNLQNGITFDGIDDFLRINDLSTSFADPARDGTWYFIFKQNGSPSSYVGRLFCAWNGNSLNFCLVNAFGGYTDGLYIGDNTGGVKWAQVGMQRTLDTAAFHSYIMQYNGSGGATGTNFNFIYDDVTQSNAAGGGQGTNTTPSGIGATGTSPSAGFAASITLMGIIIYSRKLNTTELGQLRTWRLAKFGI